MDAWMLRFQTGSGLGLSRLSVSLPRASRLVSSGESVTTYTRWEIKIRNQPSDQCVRNICFFSRPFMGSWPMSGNIRHGSVTYTSGRCCFCRNIAQSGRPVRLLFLSCALQAFGVSLRAVWWAVFGGYYLLVIVVFAKTIRNR